MEKVNKSYPPKRVGGWIGTIFFGLIIIGTISYFGDFENKTFFGDLKCAEEYKSIDYKRDYNIFYSKKIEKCVVYALLEEQHGENSLPKTRVTYRDAEKRDLLYKVLYFDFYYPDKDMLSFYKDKFEEVDK